jgi:alpha-amylase/alpha-mannosidase (GH57 family)
VTATRSLVLHGHFYQPPRENPWLDWVEAEPTAAPAHDWNRRVEQECYRAVAAARLPDATGRIARIVNTLAWMSFDFGPTLLEWMEREAAATYRAVLEADRESRARTGFGNAIAAPYHHVILPLATRRDKATEVRWGITDFRRRFGREPAGMWLPETAVDDETLDVLAVAGIAYTIVAPHQVARPPAGGRPGRYRTAAGHEIALFVYDGGLSHDVAFGSLLEDAYAWAERLLATGGAADRERVVSLATDGETFGHHHRFGEMALARLLDILGRRPGVAVTNYAAVLAAGAPTETVSLVARTSWSCAHGVERWRGDCGCRVAPERGWNQRWRAPLRTALEWLAGELHAVFEREGGALLHDPWVAREAYAETFGEPGTSLADLVAAHAARPLTADETVRVRELLQLERDALALFTSCAWFFDDVGGLEPLQVLRYAAHALELSGAVEPLERGLIERLAAAVSNDPALGDAARIYRRRARPAVAPVARVAASYAALQRFASGAAGGHVYGYDVSGSGERVRLVHRRTGRSFALDVVLESLGGWRFAVTVTAPAGAGGEPAPPARFELADLTERERDAVRSALIAAIADRAFTAQEDEALCEGRAALGDVAVRGLLARVEALAHDRSGSARAAVADLLDLLELTGRGIPFDAQSAFERVRGALSAGEAQALSALAARLGFAAAS